MWAHLIIKNENIQMKICLCFYIENLRVFDIKTANFSNQNMMLVRIQYEKQMLICTYPIHNL